MDVKLCFVRKEYFEKHTTFEKMLDAGNADKQSKRTHLCVRIEEKENSFFIPLRNNLGNDVRKFGRIGHSVPSEKRKNAGLDYRYALVVNDDAYIEPQGNMKIPKSQYQRIAYEYEMIQKEFGIYLQGFIKAGKKKRIEKEPLYRESSLINFKEELGIS